MRNQHPVDGVAMDVRERIGDVVGFGGIVDDRHAELREDRREREVGLEPPTPIEIRNVRTLLPH